MEPSNAGWSELTPAEKLERRWAAFLDPGLEFVTPEAKKEYQARATRLKKAILLEGTPDRVPVCTGTHFLPATRAGLTPYDAMYDYAAAAKAWLDYHHEFQPDSIAPPIATAIPGPAFDVLDVQSIHWPGHGAPKTSGFQYDEQEWMRADEYHLLVDDPTDYLLHVYMPRVAKGLKGLAGLVSPVDMAEVAMSAPYLMHWADPGVQASLENLRAAGEECRKWAGVHFPLMGRLMAEGFPAGMGAVSLAPFDFIGDTLRGTRGILMDMFRQPDTVLEACDKMSRILVKWVTRRATPHSAPLVGIPLHKGADSFMSEEQFKTFYWPSLRKVIMGLIEDGFVVYLFAEGSYKSRLETISDVPAGRTIWHFDQTDMRRAKQVLGGIACIQGNVPLSLLQLGTAEEVRKYCCDLVEAVAPGGGFILDMGAGADEAKDQNMHAMLQAAKDSTVY